MGSEPIKNEENKVWFILGWLGLIGLIILAVVGDKREGDKQLEFLYRQMMTMVIVQIICMVLFFFIVTYLFAVLLGIFMLIGFIIAITGKVWTAPIFGNKAREKVYGA